MEAMLLNVEILHQALLAVLQPQAHGGQYIIHYIDDDEYYEDELPKSTLDLRILSLIFLADKL